MIMILEADLSSMAITLFGVFFRHIFFAMSMQTFLLSFIPAHLQQDIQSRRKALITVASALFLTLFFGIQVVRNFIFILAGHQSVLGDFATLTPVPFVAMLVMISIPFVLRKTASLALVREMLILTYLATALVFIVFTGGASSPFSFTLLVVPLWAVNLFGARGSGISLVALASVLGIMFGLARMGVVFPQYLPQDSVSLITFVLVMSMIVMMVVIGAILERVQQESFKEMDETRFRAAAQAEEDYKKLEAMKAASEARAAEDLATIRSQREYLERSVSTMLQATE